MSFNNKKVDPKKIYSLLDLPPSLSCGGVKDKDGVDTYWGPSLTLQAEAENADISLIMQKYAKTGIITAPIKGNMVFGDASQVPTYHEAYNLIASAHEMFDALDAKIRYRFQNDPANLISFMADSSNYDEALKLGLVTKSQIKDDIGTASMAKKPSEGLKEASKEASEKA